MATNRVSSSGDRDDAVGEEAAAPAAAPSHTYTVDSSGNITPTQVLNCKVGESVVFTGANIPVEAMRDGSDRCDELFGVTEITVRIESYRVQPAARSKQYSLVTKKALRSQASAASDQHGLGEQGSGGGTVGTIKVGST